jgi:hypothetical protein
LLTALEEEIDEKVKLLAKELVAGVNSNDYATLMAHLKCIDRVLDMTRGSLATIKTAFPPARFADRERLVRFDWDIDTFDKLVSWTKAKESKF